MTSEIDNVERLRGSTWPDGVEDIVNDNECLHKIAEVDGFEHRAGCTAQRVNRPVGVLLTDRRVLFVTAAIDDDGLVDLGAIQYRHLDTLTVEDAHLTIETIDGKSVHIPVDGLAGIMADLQWFASIRERIRDLATAVEHRTLDDVPLGGHRPLRRRLDRLTCVVFQTTPVPVREIAPELDELDRRLERERVHRLLDHGESLAADGLAALDDDAVGRARERLGDARAAHTTAAIHASELDRSDGFVFGDHRAVERRLKAIETTLRDGAAALERLGTREMVRAQASASAKEKLQCWQRAYVRFDAALEALAADDPDLASVRRDRNDSAGGLATVRATLARSNASSAQRALESGDFASALDAFATTVKHLDGLSELARDLGSVDPSSIDAVRDEATELLDRLRAPAESTTAGTQMGPRLTDRIDVDAAEVAALSLDDEISLDIPDSRRG